MGARGERLAVELDPDGQLLEPVRPRLEMGIDPSFRRDAGDGLALQLAAIDRVGPAVARGQAQDAACRGDVAARLTTKRVPPQFLWQEAQDASLKSGPKPLLSPEGSAHLRSNSARPSSISPPSTNPAGKANRTGSAIRVQNPLIGYSTPWFGTDFSRPLYERRSP